jgi:hypothetical protein
MKRWYLGILVVLLAACNPLPCDPCAEIDALSTRISVLETGTSAAATHTFTPTETQTRTRTATATPTATPTFTRTATPTWTPETLVTLTPTATPPIYLLSLGASSTTALPGTRVTFTIAWDGPPARLQFQYPEHTCCAVPDVTTWATDGPPFWVQFTFLMQSNASGTKMFRVVAYDGANNLLASASVFVDVVTSNPTATFTRTPTPVPGSGQTLKAGTWYEVSNPVSEMICLKVESGGVLRGDKRLYWSDQEFWTWIEFRPGPGWRCFCGTFYWGGQRKATRLLFIFEAEVTVSDCRLCTWIQWADIASGRGVAGATCEIRG